MNLLPPTLSIGNSLNSIFVNPKVLLHSIALLSQLIQLDEVLTISVENTEEDTTSGIVLEIENLDSINLSYDSEIAYQNLLSGKFDFDTELSILLTLLNVSGCSEISYENRNLLLKIQGI